MLQTLTPASDGPTLTGLVCLGAACLAGTILLLAGGRVVRPGFISLGACVGAGLGFILSRVIGTPPWHGVPGELLGAASGLIVGLITGLLTYRVVLVVISTLTLAGAFALAGAVSLQIRGETLPSLHEVAHAARETADNNLGPRAKELGGHISEIATGHVVTTASGGQTDPKAELREAARVAGEAASQATEPLRGVWDGTTSDTRMILAGSAFIGALVGLVLGLMSPGRASVALTSLVGAAALVVSAWIAIDRFAGFNADMPLLWALAWVVLCIVGLIAQTRSPKKPAPAPAA